MSKSTHFFGQPVFGQLVKNTQPRQMARIVLMYYINIDTFFESPEKDWEIMFQKASDSPPNDSDE